MTPQISRACATLDRQLRRYLAQTLPPAQHPSQAKRRLTLRRGVVRRNLRRQKALRLYGHHHWMDVPLSADEALLVEALIVSAHPQEQAQLLRVLLRVREDPEPSAECHPTPGP